MRSAVIALLSIITGFGITVFGQDQNKLTPKQSADGWLLLYDGQSSFGWTPDGGAQWNTTPEGDLAAKAGESGVIRLNTEFGEYELYGEIKTPVGKGSGFVLNSVNIPMTKTNDKWHVLDAMWSGGMLEVKLDGKKVLSRKVNSAGTIGLRYMKGDQVAVRNLRLRPGGLKPIFNGKDLGGWRVVERAQAKVPAVWSVKDGMIHVEHGPGHLESVGQFQDFVLQLEVRTNSSDPKLHPNSGVFLRGDANAIGTGYESQIRNEFKDGDRTKPVDYGTGAIYRYQPARRVVSNDNEFFVKTIVAKGRHFSIWVDGVQVTDWDDPHPEGTVVRNQQAKLGAGTLSLQAHDPTTNLDFRNLRIVELSALKRD